MATHEDDIFLDSLLVFDDCFPQAPFALAGFVAEQMFFAALAAFQFARGGHSKAFLTAFMGLHLGHGRFRGHDITYCRRSTLVYSNVIVSLCHSTQSYN